MISCELKKDIRGILYLDDSSDLQSRLLVIDENDHKSDTPRNSFYSLKTTSDYIIKKPSIGLDRKERIAYMNMLVSFLKKQSMVTKTELPIGYYREKRKLAGLIIRYYQ